MKLAIGLLFVLASAGSALAQSAAGDIAKTQSEIADDNRQISDAQAQATQINGQLAAKQQEFDSIKARHDALQQQYATDAANYNASCAGQPTDYNNCGGQQAQMLSEQQTIGAQVADLEQQAAALQSQAQELVSELTLANARVQKLTNDKSQLEASLQAMQAAPAKHVATSEPVANKCEGTFCKAGNPKNPDIGPTTKPQKQTKYSSASAQADAMKKAPGDAGCVFEGRGGCASGTPMTFPNSGAGRGTASLSPAVREAMSKSPEDKKLMGEEAALRTQLADANAKADALKAKRDAVADGPARQKLAVEYANADQVRGQIGQKLSVKEIAVETAAKKYVLDK
jgi:chromosome segregation ATPase